MKNRFVVLLDGMAFVCSALKHRGRHAETFTVKEFLEKVQRRGPQTFPLWDRTIVVPEEPTPTPVTNSGNEKRVKEIQS